MGQWDTTALLFLDFKFRPKSTTGGEPLPRRRGSIEGRARRAALQEAERLADLGDEEEARAWRGVVNWIKCARASPLPARPTFKGAGEKGGPRSARLADCRPVYEPFDLFFAQTLLTNASHPVKW
jgi:hypothetical protein